MRATELSFEDRRRTIALVGGACDAGDPRRVARRRAQSRRAPLGARAARPHPGAAAVRAGDAAGRRSRRAGRRGLTRAHHQRRRGAPPDARGLGAALGSTTAMAAPGDLSLDDFSAPWPERATSTTTSSGGRTWPRRAPRVEIAERGVHDAELHVRRRRSRSARSSPPRPSRDAGAADDVEHPGRAQRAALRRRRSLRRPPRRPRGARAGAPGARRHAHRTRSSPRRRRSARSRCTRPRAGRPGGARPRRADRPANARGLRARPGDEPRPGDLRAVAPAGRDQPGAARGPGRRGARERRRSPTRSASIESDRTDRSLSRRRPSRVSILGSAWLAACDREEGRRRRRRRPPCSVAPVVRARRALYIEAVASARRVRQRRHPRAREGVPARRRTTRTARR